MHFRLLSIKNLYIFKEFQLIVKAELFSAVMSQTCFAVRASSDALSNRFFFLDFCLISVIFAYVRRLLIYWLWTRFLTVALKDIILFIFAK